MAYTTLTLLLAVFLTICINVDAVENPRDNRVINDVGTSWRFPNPFVFGEAQVYGRHMYGRQECITGCQPGEKCCTSPEGAQFCIPENAVCCGRTWCDGELELCCRDGPHGGCCPKDSQCATGNKGCCLKDRPCFGPYICYDNLSVECKNSTVEAFQCCPESAPYCLFDPGNGYGCFVSKDLPTYTTPIVEVPTTVVKAPTSEPEGNAPTTAAGSVTETSNSANSEATSSPSGTSPTGSGTPLTSAGSTNLASSSGLGSPSSGSGGPSVPYGSKMASTTTRRNTTTLGPSSTDGASGGGAVATAGIGYGFFKQVGIAGLALLVIA